MAKNWIPLRQVEGTASRQAHVRLPEGTYEREISKEGFFGPSAQFHHKHKPTDWVEFDGAIRDYTDAIRIEPNEKLHYHLRAGIHTKTADRR